LLVDRHDLVIANDAATIPASVSGIHLPTGAAVEVRLAARDSLSPRRVARFTAVLFGAGDYRTPTEHRPLPPAVRVGDRLQLGPLHAVVTALHGHARLIDLTFDGSPSEIWEGLARHGRPIQYSHVPAPLAIWDTWTRIAGQPVAFEPPSAGFLLTWRMIHELRARGARLATITHAAGISSTGDDQLDARLPLDEPYFIPRSTVAAIQQTKRHGGRVIAIGTTVVRALEHAAGPRGGVKVGKGVATQRLGPRSSLRVVDAIVSGVHEPGSSHYELLQAFQPDDVLKEMHDEAGARGYLAHEFGDSVFMTKAAAPRATRLSPAHRAAVTAAVATLG
jgi:S-adenosylmethionine:tRNA ribosyltransferase-isomerase